MDRIKGAEGRRSGHIITADPGTGLIDITEKDISVEVEEGTALYVYASAGQDDVPEPSDLIAVDM